MNRCTAGPGRIGRLAATLFGVALALAGEGAAAQLALPGAAGDAPAASDAPAPADAPKPRPRRRPRPAAPFSVDPASALGRTLRLNGRNGELELARGDGDSLKIVKYSLLGEVVSHPAQQCRIAIVADAPISAASKGDPDGLPRYSADIPACPLTFDVVADGIYVAPQNNACVFAAADCQASPSGLWGPEAGDLDKERAGISKARAAADRSIQDSLKDLERRDKDAAASLAREANDFAAERDDLCRDYAAEPRLGFCASRLAQTRAALLAKRVAEAGPPPPEKKRRRREN